MKYNLVVNDNNMMYRVMSHESMLVTLDVLTNNYMLVKGNGSPPEEMPYLILHYPVGITMTTIPDKLVFWTFKSTFVCQSKILFRLVRITIMAGPVGCNLTNC